MEFANTGAQIYVPDGTAVDKAISRTTHMAVGAHQDATSNRGPCASSR